MGPVPGSRVKGLKSVSFAPADRSSCEHPCAGLPLCGGRRRSDASPGRHPARSALLPEGEAGNGGGSSGKPAASSTVGSDRLLLLALKDDLSAVSGALQLSDRHPVSGGRGRSEDHHRRPAGGDARRRPWPPTGRHHRLKCLLCSYSPGLQRSHSHAAVGPDPPAERLQRRGPLPELGHHQLHHQGP